MQYFKLLLLLDMDEFLKKKEEKYNKKRYYS